jgi:hypothetical protein
VQTESSASSRHRAAPRQVRMGTSGPAISGQARSLQMERARLRGIAGLQLQTRFGRTGDEVRPEWDVISGDRCAERDDESAHLCRATKGRICDRYWLILRSRSRKSPTDRTVKCDSFRLPTPFFAFKLGRYGWSECQFSQVVPERGKEDTVLDRRRAAFRPRHQRPDKTRP